MAGTFYNYAERKADSFVNWAEIGKGISDMLSTENKIREEKKAAIDKASLEFGQTLSEAPQGDSKDLNEWALEYAANAQEARLMQDRLLKSGQLSVKDYTMMRQNITDGTTQAFNLLKEYNAEYSSKMERYKTEKSQELERWLMEQAESFGNFRKSSLYINPTDFKVSVALKEKKIVDGKEVYAMSDNPNNFTTVNALRNRIKGTFDKYDLSGNVAKMVDALGEEKTAVQKIATMFSTGSITETLDITKRSNLPADAKGVIMKFEEAETKMLQAQLQNPYNVSSILTNTIGTAPNGQQYSFTFNPEEAKKNPHLILVKDSDTGSPVPSFTPEQEKAALERLRLEARMMYDKTTETKVTPQIQLQERRALNEGEREDRRLRDESKNVGQQLSNLLTGTPTQRSQARAYFEQAGATIDLSDPRGMTVYGSDGKPTKFEYGDINKPGAAVQLARSLARSLSGGGMLYENEIINEASRQIGNKPLNTSTMAFESGGILPKVVSFANNAVSKFLTTANQEKTVTNLGRELSRLGFSVTGTQDNKWFGADQHFITIKAPNGVTSEPFNINTLNNNSAIKKFIVDNQDPTISMGALRDVKAAPSQQANRIKSY